MPSIICPTQRASIGSRQILDPILIANEVVEKYRSKKEKGWIIKLDLVKAFDQVDWEFLENVLVLKGFDDKWIKWINGCIRTQCFQSSSIADLASSRVIRQGDMISFPLSPFPFPVSFSS